MYTNFGQEVLPKFQGIAPSRRNPAKILRQGSRGREEPVANSVPNTQPAFARAARELRLGRQEGREFLALPAFASIPTGEGCPAEAPEGSEGGPPEASLPRAKSVPPKRRSREGG